MNKKMILPFVAILVLAVAMVGAASADEVTTVDKVEVRGEVVRIDNATSPELVWNATNFAGFWYDLDDDLMTETLWINASVLKATTTGAGEDRTIEEDKLWYTTSPEFQEYELHENEADPDRDNKTAMEIEYGVNKGLCVESDRDGGDCGYFIEGFMAKKYIAIDANADKLCELLVEFEDDDKKTLATGEEWDLGSGFSLAANQIDLEGDKVWFTLNKDGKELDSEVISTDSTRADRVYTYTADIGNEEEIPVFSCYVDAVFRGTDSNIVQVMYVFLIDDDVMEIDTSDTYGIMEVMTASKNRVTLRNNEDTLDLDTDTTEKIMGDMYFKTADNAPTDNQIRFYPFVEYTIGEGAPGEAEEEEEVETPVNETAEENVTAAAEVTPTPEPTAAVEETVTDAEEPAAPEETATPKTPGFEAVFAIAGLLAVAYLVLRQRE